MMALYQNKAESRTPSLTVWLQVPIEGTVTAEGQPPRALLCGPTLLSFLVRISLVGQHSVNMTVKGTVTFQRNLTSPRGHDFCPTHPLALLASQTTPERGHLPERIERVMKQDHDRMLTRCLVCV